MPPVPKDFCAGQHLNWLAAGQAVRIHRPRRRRTAPQLQTVLDA